jgi:hypothetical protein
MEIGFVKPVQGIFIPLSAIYQAQENFQLYLEGRARKKK